MMKTLLLFDIYVEVVLSQIRTNYSNYGKLTILKERAQ